MVSGCFSSNGVGIEDHMNRYILSIMLFPLWTFIYSQYIVVSRCSWNQSYSICRETENGTNNFCTWSWPQAMLKSCRWVTQKFWDTCTRLGRAVFEFKSYQASLGFVKKIRCQIIIQRTSMNWNLVNSRLMLIC